MVRQFPLFSDISSAACSEIVSVGREKAFARRQTIFSQGDPIEKVFLLTSGSVKTTQLGQNGSEVILRLCGAGDLIGSCKAHSARPLHRSIAQSLKPSQTLIWDVATFESLCVRYPVLRQNVARILDQQLGELEERYREISTECVPMRLSREISRLANRVGEQVKDAVKINLSREELAQLTGTTLFTVSRLLSQWKEQGIVSPGREIVVIKNAQALAELCERGNWPDREPGE
jgi:CRP-like cAMP-binding protein